MRRLLFSITIIALLFTAFGCSDSMSYSEYIKKTDDCIAQNQGKYNVTPQVLEYACTKYVSKQDRAVFEQVIKDLS